MKKIISTIGSLLLAGAVTVGVCACGDGEGSSGGIAGLDDGKFRVAMLISGDLGDMSFWDSANEGMTRFKKDHPEADVSIIEMGSSDTTVYESTLTKTANEAYDLIIVGTSDMREPLQRLVKKSKYSDRRFLIFDTEIKDNKAADFPTVHSVMFNQNEGGYLAGVLSALMTKDAAADNTAFIGGAQNDIINDFACGFMQGVKSVNDAGLGNFGAYKAFIGDFTDSPKGKSLAQTYYQNGVPVLFAAASQAGLGCIEAAKAQQKYIIGVDSDQYAFYENSDSGKAATIVTSIVKKVGDMLYESCEKFMANELTYGDLEILGVKDGKIGYVDNDNFKSIVSQENRTYLANVAAGISGGTITVKSGLKRNMSAAELNALFDSLDPAK